MNNNLPFISIIIPCRNEGKFIGKCLDSIIAQDYPKHKMEVLVVDGMSEDETYGIIEGYSRQYPFIRVLKNPEKITPVALNLGIKNAKDNIIIRMDAHAEYLSNFISTAVAYLETFDADVVGGPINTLPGADTLMARAISLATSHPFGVGNSKFRTSRKEGYVDTVPFGAYRREVFNKVGLFNEQLVRNQDNELNSRIIKSGGKIYSTPKLTANYYNQSTLAGLLKQALKAGMWNVFTVIISYDALKLRHFIPFAFVTVLVTLFFIALVQSWAKFVFFGLVLLYGIAAIISTISIWLKERTFSVVFLPLIFPAYHISYGLGTWGGLLKIVLSRTVNLDKLLAKNEGSSGTT